jgi:hypothetical protein
MSNDPARRAFVLASLALVLLVSACSSEDEFKRTSFLPSYTQLRLDNAPSGGKRMIYVSPAFTPDRYDALIMEPAIYFPDAEPTLQVPAETLAAILASLDASLRQSLSQRVRLTDTPKPGVARWRLALTTAHRSGDAEEDAEAYVPMALVMTSTMARAEGGVPREPVIALELQITDSLTQEPLLLLVRGGSDRDLEAVQVDTRAPLSAEALQPLFDVWAQSAAEQAGQYIKPK